MRILIAISLAFLLALDAPAGDLNPPGAPAPTMVTLDDLDAAIDGVEVRIPIDTLPAGASALHEIGAPGSYYLRQDLVGAAGLSGILATANNVTIDLNGFEIVGVPGAVHGVNFHTTAGLLNVEVKNGSIRDWPSYGIVSTGLAGGVSCRLNDLVAHGCGLGGVVLNGGAVARNCVFRANAQYGLFATGVIENCLAELNDVGFHVGGSIRGCVAANNLANGFTVVGGVVENCRSFNNAGAGIVALGGIVPTGSARVVNSVSHYNGSDGIRVNDSSFVSGCESHFNGVSGAGAGIRATNANNRIEGNNVGNNDAGIDCDMAGNVVVRNSARANTDNYGQIVGGNDVGPIGTAAASTSPWANIAY